MVEPCAAHEITIKSFEQFQENQKEIVNTLSSLRERTVITEQSTKSAHHRLDKQEEQTEAIVKISTSIEHLAEQVKDMLSLFKEHDDRIVKLERAPGDNINRLWKLFITASVTCAAGLFVSWFWRRF